MHISKGAETVDAAVGGFGVAAGVGRYDGVLDGPAACAVTDWSKDEAGDDAACGVESPGPGRLNILSIVGRKAAPNGVERKSAGKSTDKLRQRFSGCW